jgi:hypothetical protein
MIHGLRTAYCVLRHLYCTICNLQAAINKEKTMTTETTPTMMERMQVTGNELVDQFKQLIHAGNVRRIIITHEDAVIAEFPLTIGVIGAVFAPVLAAVGAIAAVVTECTIEVERVEEPAALAAPVAALPVPPVEQVEIEKEELVGV